MVSIRTAAGDSARATPRRAASPPKRCSLSRIDYGNRSTAMSKPDAMAAVGKLIAAVPQATIPEATVAAYADHLSDIQPPLLAATINRVIETLKFFPAIS